MNETYTRMYARRGLVVIGVILIIVAAVLTYNNYDAQLKAVALKNAQLAEQQSIFNEAQANVPTVADLTAQGTAVANSAKIAGEAVAVLENRMVELTIALQNAVSESQEQSIYNEIGEIAIKMDNYFGENTKLRSLWYAGAINPAITKWVFVTNYSFVEEEAPVLWLLKDTNENVLAYVVATYYATSDSFGNEVCHITTTGNALVPATYSDEHPADIVEEEFSIDDIMSIVNASDEIPEGWVEVPEPTEDEVNETTANNQLRDALREQQMGE